MAADLGSSRLVRGRGLMLALLTVGLIACTATHGSSQGPSQGPQAAGSPKRPARVVAVETLGPRLRDLTIDSPALGQRAKVRLLLPRRFAAEPARRWPVLWLLHGCCDTYQSWTRSTDVQDLPGLAEVLVVMPEAGQVGFYSDWYNGGDGGPPQWETFHLVELRQLLERDWRAGDHRVVAVVSMGGLGAMAYAARHPGMFQAAASYSGILDTRYQGGPLDTPAPTQQARQLEQALQPQALAFVVRLRQAGIPVEVDAYGPGTHDWPYWQRELHRSLPLLQHALESR